MTRKAQSWPLYIHPYPCQIQTALLSLHRYLKPRGLSVLDVMPREYDELLRPTLIGVENGRADIDVLFMALRSLQDRKSVV